MHRIDGAGHVGNMFVSEDPATNRPPTEITEGWLNAVQEELAAAATKDGEELGASSHQIADVLGCRIRFFGTGIALPTLNIGPIWHNDYASVMTWQAFTANGAAYTGYASVLVGSLLIDTQPTARAGYVKSGVANLSRTAYAALRGWAMHNGLMVAAGAWAAGNIAVKDNADGTTFTVFDVRGEFPRFWDDGRGVDSGRPFSSNQLAAFESHTHSHAGKYAVSDSGSFYAMGYGTTSSLGNTQVDYTGGTETRPRNTAFLAAIKY